MFNKHTKSNKNSLLIIALTCLLLLSAIKCSSGLDESTHGQKDEPKYDAIRQAQHLDVGFEEEQLKGNKPTTTLLGGQDTCSDMQLQDGAVVPGCWSFNTPVDKSVCHATSYSSTLNIFCRENVCCSSILAGLLRFYIDIYIYVYKWTILALLCIVLCIDSMDTQKKHVHESLRGGAAFNSTSSFEEIVELIPNPENYNYNVGTLVQMTGDGNCGYNCIAHFLSGDMVLSTTTLNALNLFRMFIGDQQCNLTGANLRKLFHEQLVEGTDLYTYLTKEKHLSAEMLCLVQKRASYGSNNARGWAQGDVFTILGVLFDICIVIYAEHINTGEPRWTEWGSTSSAETCYIYNHRLHDVEQGFYDGIHFDILTNLGLSSFNQLLLSFATESSSEDENGVANGIESMTSDNNITNSKYTSTLETSRKKLKALGIKLCLPNSKNGKTLYQVVFQGCKKQGRANINKYGFTVVLRIAADYLHESSRALVAHFVANNTFKNIVDINEKKRLRVFIYIFQHLIATETCKSMPENMIVNILNCIFEIVSSMQLSLLQMLTETLHPRQNERWKLIKAALYQFYHGQNFGSVEEFKNYIMKLIKNVAPVETEEIRRLKEEQQLFKDALNEKQNNIQVTNLKINEEENSKSQDVKRLENYKEKMKNCKRLIELRDKSINELSEQNANAALDITETKKQYDEMEKRIKQRKYSDMNNNIQQCIDQAETERKEAEEERSLQNEIKNNLDKQAQIDEMQQTRKRETEEKIKRLQAEFKNTVDEDIMGKAQLEKEYQLLCRRSKKRRLSPNADNNIDNVCRKRSRSNSPPVLMGANLNTPKTMERNAKEQTMSLNYARCPQCSGIMREDPAGSYQCDCCSYKRDRMN